MPYFATKDVTGMDGSMRLVENVNNDGDIEKNLSFVFEGSSWGCIFYIGVWHAIKKQFTQNQLRHARFGGSSSGTLAALGACLDKTPEDVRELYEGFAHLANTFGVFGYMSLYHEVALRRWLPVDGDEWKMLTGRLHVNITRFFNRSEIISDWKSNEEVIDAMHCMYPPLS